MQWNPTVAPQNNRTPTKTGPIAKSVLEKQRELCTIAVFVSWIALGFKFIHLILNCKFSLESLKIVVDLRIGLFNFSFGACDSWKHKSENGMGMGMEMGMEMQIRMRMALRDSVTAVFPLTVDVGTSGVASICSCISSSSSSASSASRSS